MSATSHLESVPSQPSTGKPMYRMPVGFGPSIGPRQGPGRRSFNGEWSRCTTVGVSFRTDGDLVAKLLPPGFEPADDPIVRVQTHFNTDFAWLAGRGYNFAEVLFAAVYRGEEDTLEGDFVAVMWESMADPIIPGREEIGLPKLFGDIPPLESDGSSTRMSVSWEGFRFLDLELEGLDLEPWPSEREADAEVVRAGIGGRVGRHRMYYKYIPKTGAWGEADAEYATASKPDQYDLKVLDSWEGDGSVTFHEATWEDLPTMVHIINPLAGLPVHEITDASMGRVMVSFHDLRDQRILR